MTQPQTTPAAPASPFSPAPQFQRLLVIINPAAGVDRPLLGVLNDALRERGITWEVKITQDAGDARRFAQSAAADGFDIVAAHGGDGTVMEVADGLRESGLPLAILPGGTANVMAGELGVPYDLAAAADLIGGPNSELRTIDMGRAEETTFLLRVGIGFEAEFTKNTDQELKNRFGLLAYAFTALNELRTLTPSTYHITVDGQTHSVEGVSCMIANSGNITINGLRFSEKVDVSDGLLDVIVFTNANLTTLINITRAVLTQADTTEQDPVMHWHGRHISVEADPPQAISIDGEQIEPRRVTAEILPNAVRVLVPRAQPPADAESADA